ncbi:MAG: selenium-dependent xanthine dehydrogenase [Bacteroidetes bacterium]|nr:selenium-dependent xanthine dehydrogenase [Bacteroidota bacterium]
MITFNLNNHSISFHGDGELSLLKFLRNEQHITSVKDGCSAQAACGACMVEINGKPRLACTTKMNNLENAHVFTMEGFPEYIKQTFGKAFVEKGGVQCGFCTPGFIMRTKILLQNNPTPTKDEIREALKLNLCRCTGYKKIEEAIEYAAEHLKANKEIIPLPQNGKVGTAYPKYNAYETAIGERNFVNDIQIEGMLHSALRFSDYPRAKVLKINIEKAVAAKGVVGVFTAKDIPAAKKIGLIYNDWSLMIDENEVTHYIGDVIAGIVADTEENARKASALIEIDYEILTPVTDAIEALKQESPLVHEDHSNLLDKCIIKRGNADDVIAKAKYVSKGIYQTQRIEHAYLETEAAIAYTVDDGIEMLCQSQGVYEDRRQVSMILGLPEEKVRVVLIPNGGGFGGKEDMTVQGHVSLLAWLLKKPVKLALSRDESIIMHPKRHPVYMDMQLACDENGKLTALKLLAIGDSGAYASVGTKVMERVAGHACSGYYIPHTDIESKTVYTNNIPSGAMRGFGANQVAFALESCIDDLCRQGGFDRWQFRYDNALVDGLSTATGQKLKAVGIRACLLALKDDYDNAEFKGIATAIKNSGIGNGMTDYSNVIIEIVSENKVIIQHGWTEMGQGVHTMALQTLCEETGIPPEIIEVKVDTNAQIKTGMTTSSRATALLGNAIINACISLKQDIANYSLSQLVGKKYHGEFICDWTTKPGAEVEEVITHYSYGYAAQLVVLDEKGRIEKVVAAHDAGKIMNPMLFEGQIQGAVHMGLGYALCEALPMKDGYLLSTRLRDCNILRAHETPEIIVKGVEVPDEVGPYGVKGIGEIGLVPTAAAVANAYTAFDGIKRMELPINIRK